MCTHPSVLWGLTRYPDTETELHDLISFLLTQIVGEAFPGPVTCVVSKDLQGKLGPIEVPEKIAQHPGVAFVFREVPDDTIFLLAANLHADAMIHSLELPNTPGPAFAIWTRREGMSAVTVSAGEVYDLAGSVTQHLLPRSLSVSVLH